MSRVLDLSVNEITLLDDLSLRDDPGIDIDRLAQSIGELDLLEPVVVTDSLLEGTYVLLAGQRRYYACRELGLASISAIVRSDVTTLGKGLMIALHENSERVQLTDLEAARVGRKIKSLIAAGEIIVPPASGSDGYSGRTDDFIAGMVNVGRMKWRDLDYAVNVAEEHIDDLVNVLEGLQNGSLSAAAARRTVESYLHANEEAPPPEYRPTVVDAPDHRAAFVRSMAFLAGTLYDSIVDDTVPEKPVALIATVNGKDYRVEVEVVS